MYACPIVASVQLSPHPTPPRSLRATSRVEMSGTDCRSTHRSCSSSCHPYRLVLTVPPPPAPSAHLPSHTVPCTPLHTLTTPLHYTQLTHPMSRFQTDLIPMLSHCLTCGMLSPRFSRVGCYTGVPLTSVDLPWNM